MTGVQDFSTLTTKKAYLSQRLVAKMKLFELNKAENLGSFLFGKLKRSY